MEWYDTLPKLNSPAADSGGGASLRGGVTSYANDIDKYASKYGVDSALMKAIIHHETGDMTSNAAKNKKNFGGIMGSNGLNSYPTVEAGLEAVAKLLSTSRYKGKSIDKIGAIYAPVGAANDPTGLNKSWVSGVTSYYKKYRG